MPSKSNKEKQYHTMLEDTVVLLRKYINTHVDEMDDLELLDICKLLRDIEQLI